MHHRHFVSDIMKKITEFLSRDHERCDALFFQAESHASAGQWQQAEAQFQLFHSALERHLKIEEEVLFVEMEHYLDSGFRPTDVMRSEHQRMREIVRELAAAAQKKDINQFLGLTETLNIMMQQHNLKEESVLYPMADRLLASARVQLLDEMDELTATEGN